jgi:hypothetical protein
MGARAVFDTAQMHYLLDRQRRKIHGLAYSVTMAPSADCAYLHHSLMQVSSWCSLQIKKLDPLAGRLSEQAAPARVQQQCLGKARESCRDTGKNCTPPACLWLQAFSTVGRDM